MNKIWKFIISIAVCQLAGAIGSFFTAPEIDNWYASLTRPSIAPPNWVFAPVWTTLFFLMGLAVYLVWLKGSDKKEVKLALQDAGRKLALYVRKTIRAREQQERVNLFEKYIPELAKALAELSEEKPEKIQEELEKSLKKGMKDLLAGINEAKDIEIKGENIAF